MSAINLHSMSANTVKIWGVERHYMGRMVANAALSLVGSAIDQKDFLISIGKGDMSDHERNLYMNRVIGGAIIMDHDAVKRGDKHDSLFTVVLNTALVMGSDSLKLAARLHGQCELHCYVESANRDWLACIIEESLENNVLRRALKSNKEDISIGWDEAIKLLRSRSDEPVVFSYSVCESFPCPIYWEKYDPEDEASHDAFYEMSKVEQWASTMPNLRELNKTSRCELTPDNWKEFRFGLGFSFFDVARER